MGHWNTGTPTSHVVSPTFSFIEVNFVQGITVAIVYAQAYIGAHKSWISSYYFKTQTLDSGK